MLVFCLFLYGNTIKNNFSLDDEYVSLNHQQVKKGFGGIPEIFTSYYTTGSNTTDIYGYRPVVKATYAIEYQFFGENPHVSHFINILIYALIGVLLFKLLKKLLSNYNRVLSLAITFLFISHPIHTEVVASIKNRDVLLSFLGSVLLIQYAILFIGEKKIKHLLLAIVWGAFSFLSKPETIPVVLIIPFATYFFTNYSFKKSIGVSALIMCVGLCIHFGINVLFPENARHYSSMEYHDNPLYFINEWEITLGVGFNTLFFYLKKLIFPYPLLYFYGYNTIPIESVFSPTPLISFLTYLGLAFIAIRGFLNKSVGVFGIIWYLGFAFVVSNILIPGPGIVAERFIFSASLGFCIAAAFYILKFLKVPIESTSDRIATNTNFNMLAVLVLLIFSSVTIARNSNWKDQLTLFRHDIKHLDNSVKAHEMLGAALMKESNLSKTEQERAELVAESINHYKRTIEIYPNFAMGNCNLGAFYSNLYNDCETATPYFQKAISIDSLFGEAYINMGLCNMRMNKVDGAIGMLEKGIKIEQGKFLVSYTSLMALYFIKKDFKKAEKIFEESINYFPNSEVPYREMGNQYMNLKDTAEAAKYLSTSLHYKSDSQLKAFLLNYYASINDELMVNKIR